MLLAANKAEGQAGLSGAMEAYGLGLGEPILLSAEHGEGMEALYDALAQRRVAIDALYRTLDVLPSASLRTTLEAMP